MTPASAPSILAVIVLYKVQAEASQSFLALQSLLTTNSDLARSIVLTVYDNTPYEQPRPAGFTGQYFTDIANPGLARCYNQALAIAQRHAIPWLLLLDQDTTPTVQYLREVLEQLPQAQPSTIAFVPKLIQKGTVLSPYGAPTYKHPRFDRSAYGTHHQRLYAYNSGSVLRVQALTAIGGFPEEFWLDFLDHATFHKLQAAGGRLFVLHSELTHELSAISLTRKDAAAKKRYQNTLDAEYTFYQKYGTLAERVFYRIRTVRSGLGDLLKRRQRYEALRKFEAATRF